MPIIQVTAAWKCVTLRPCNNKVYHWTILILFYAEQLQGYCHHAKDCSEYANLKKKSVW